MSSCEKEEKCCTINKGLFAYKMHYFLLSAAHVGVVPYLPVYAKTTLGCSATTVGILATCMQFSTTISKPLFGLLADCLNQMKVLIVLLLTIEVLLNLLMLALSPVATVNPMNHANETPIGANIFLRFSPPKFSTGLFTKPNSSQKKASNTDLFFHVSANSVQNSATFPHQKLRNSENQRCKLNCETFIIDATCNRNESICIKNGTANLLTCSLNHKTIIPFCKEFRRRSNFTITFEIESFQKNENKYKTVRNQVIYYKKNYHGTETFCKVTSPTCHLICKESIPHCPENYENETPNLYGMYQFWLFCAFALLGAMCQGALYTLSDTVCYERLRGTSANFGHQRLWGSIGYGVMAPITGYIDDRVTGQSPHKNYTPGWYVMTVLSLCVFLNLYCMKIQEPKRPQDKCQNFKDAICNRQFILMEINVFFIGVLTAYNNNYGIWYMESLGGNSMQMGLSLAVGCILGESPFMYFSRWLISKLGHWNVVTLSFITFAAKFGIYYIIVDPWLFLPVELMDGIVFGLFYTAMTSFGEQISTPGTGATVQGILGGTYQGLGCSIGCLIAGISFDKFGGRNSFLMASIAGACLALSQSVLYLICKPRKEEKLNSLEK